MNVSTELMILTEPEITFYLSRLQEAVYDIVLKDIKLNLRHNLPACYQSQLNKDITLYLAFSLTRLVPEFHVKWYVTTHHHWQLLRC